MRTFVMGDIHGNYRGLLQCLELSGFDKEKDKLIQIGDVADGWSETPECVDELLTIKNLVAIRGNHDIWCWNWFKDGWQDIVWTTQGGQATIDAYIRTGQVVDQAHKDFWDNQVNWYTDDENRLFIHGGWDYTIGFPEGALVPAYGVGPRAMQCHWDRELLMGALSAAVGKNGRFKALEQFEEVYVGHTAIRHPFKPHNALNLWNVDTGGGWHGKLTIMDIDTKEYWQSDLAPSLYPNELGR